MAKEFSKQKRLPVKTLHKFTKRMCLTHQFQRILKLSLKCGTMIDLHPTILCLRGSWTRRKTSLVAAQRFMTIDTKMVSRSIWNLKDLRNLSIKFWCQFTTLYLTESWGIRQNAIDFNAEWLDEWKQKISFPQLAIEKMHIEFFLNKIGSKMNLSVWNYYCTFVDNGLFSTYLIAILFDLRWFQRWFISSRRRCSMTASSCDVNEPNSLRPVPSKRSYTTRCVSISDWTS